jgi:hypothetical protein
MTAAETVEPTRLTLSSVLGRTNENKHALLYERFDEAVGR